MLQRIRSLISYRIGPKDWILNPSVRAFLLRTRNPVMPEPWFVQIEPTTRCNMACAHCSRVPGGHEDLTFNTFSRIISTNPNIRVVKLQGFGEPMMAQRTLLECAQYAKSRGLFVEVVTNGNTKIPDMLGNYIDAITVSIESINPETYSLIRSGGYALDHAMDTVNLITQFPGNVKKFINCVRTNVNSPEEVNEVIEFGASKGFRVCTPMMENWSPGNEVYGFAVRKAYQIHDETVCFRAPWCFWGYTHAYYDCYGNLHPCCIRMDNKYSFCTSKWNSPEMQEFRKQKRELDTCKSCPL